MTAEISVLRADTQPRERKDRLRVVVLGSSVSGMVTGDRPAEGPYLTYPGVLGRCVASGVELEVIDRSRVYGLVSDFKGAVCHELLQDRPDVVVIQLGTGEAFPKLLPRFFVMHLLSLRRGTGAVRDRYWVLMRRLLKRWSQLEGKIDAHMPAAWSRVSSARFERSLRRLCVGIMEQIGARVVLMEPTDVTARAFCCSERLLGRIRSNREIVYTVAADLKLEVFPINRLLHETGLMPLPDGLHLSCEAHRIVGLRLAALLINRTGDSSW